MTHHGQQDNGCGKPSDLTFTLHFVRGYGLALTQWAQKK
jgi:hypothetical protein